VAPPKDEDKATDGVPKPELSPTHNPLLAQNLGLWAKVYYTTPPEQREQAVEELLRELKGEGGSGSEGQAALASSGAGAGRKDALSRQAQEENLVCPACFHKNHAEQRWCGLCGFPLPAQGKSPSVEVSRPAAAPLPVPVPPPKPIERGDQSWDWLREKNAAAFETSSESNGGWKYAVTAASVVLVLAIGLVWWAYSAGPKSAATSMRNEKRAVTPPQPMATEPAHPAPSQSSPQSVSAPKPTVQPDEGPVSTPAKAAPAANSSPPRGENQNSPPVADSTSIEDGQEELLQARRFLDGQGVPRDSMVASRLLWKAVAKKNSQAVLLLSDLYVRGDGVSKSCDQARVLLSMAAQRGSAAAQVKLDEIRQSACR
jgi:hypothetical protein